MLCQRLLDGVPSLAPDCRYDDGSSFRCSQSSLFLNCLHCTTAKSIAHFLIPYFHIAQIRVRGLSLYEANDVLGRSQLVIGLGLRNVEHEAVLTLGGTRDVSS
jgi:hypothetical protein